jgi:hypothetical protein
MSIKCTVPLNVTEEANARIDALGLRTQFERMVDHACEVVRDLQRIDVRLEPYYDRDDDFVQIEYVKAKPLLENDSVGTEVAEWEFNNFPREVRMHLTTAFVIGVPHAG